MEQTQEITCIGIKKVKAAPMHASEAMKRGYRVSDVTLSKDLPSGDGVEVTYEDGYKSWCPMNTFKKHNHLCEGLVETALLMVSEDYKEHFKAEYLQLKIRYDKLLNIVATWDNGELEFAPTCPRSTYDLQIEAMGRYLAVLEIRAKIEGVEL